MKALALATLGLGGLVMAGSAFAACPTLSTNTGNSTPGGGGAWSSQSVGGGGYMNITGAGLAGTSCALYVNVGATPLANVKAFVSDTSPQNESRYRARFYFDVSALTLSLANYQTRIFNAFANSAPGSFNTDEVRILLVGGATPSLRFYVADAGQSSGFASFQQSLPSSASGHYYVEFDLTNGAGSSSAVSCAGGAAGCFRYWVTAEGTASSDGSPAGTYSANNGGWSGIKQANLGLFSVSTNFRSNNLSKNFAVDEFDSRRQTFIGQ